MMMSFKNNPVLLPVSKCLVIEYFLFLSEKLKKSPNSLFYNLPPVYLFIYFFTKVCLIYIDLGL